MVEIGSGAKWELPDIRPVGLVFYEKMLEGWECWKMRKIVWIRIDN